VEGGSAILDGHVLLILISFVLDFSLLCFTVCLYTVFSFFSKMFTKENIIIIF
jgi:hypothetical protein